MTSKQWLIATIFTLITICAWVAFGILHERAKVEIDPKVQEVIQPINPDFDTSGIESQ